VSEMVERVKAAIEEAFLAQRVAAASWHPGAGIIPPIDVVEIARAVIAAMREPTEAMVDEGWYYAYEENALKTWQSMIDEALR
jgi:hypothetical protein